MQQTRQPVFRGTFYPASAKELADAVTSHIDAANVRGVAGARAYIAPHAGYVYSGRTAGFTYKAMSAGSRAKAADTIVIIGPNHTGLGKKISVSMADWSTPLGIALNDTDLSAGILRVNRLAEQDERAHSDEHSIEVQLPYLKKIFPEKRFVFICMMDQSAESANALAKSIVEASDALGRKTVVLASSDMNHYEQESITKDKDMRLIGAIERLDMQSFADLVKKLPSSTCGPGPIIAAMRFGALTGAKRAKLLDYSTSASAGSDAEHVVGYSSAAVL